MSPIIALYSALVAVFVLSTVHGQQFGRTNIDCFRSSCIYSLLYIPNFPNQYLKYGNGSESDLGRAVDGIGMLKKVLETGTNATEGSNELSSSYTPQIRRTSAGTKDILKLVTILHHYYAIKNLSVADRVTFDAATAVMDQIAIDTCTVLKKHLLEAFNCTAAEVIELEARLQYAVTMDRLYDQLRGMETQVQSQADTPTTDERQCKYWNSQVLENYNCNRGNNEDVPAGVTMRDNDYVTNLYQDSCNCCSRHGPICFIRE